MLIVCVRVRLSSLLWTSRSNVPLTGVNAKPAASSAALVSVTPPLLVNWLKADKPLPLRIDFVEFERERAGQIVQSFEKAADDFVAGRVQARELAGRRVERRVRVDELDDARGRRPPCSPC